MGDLKFTADLLKGFLRCAGIAVLAGGMMNAGADSISIAEEFEGIDCAEFVSAYKKAYVEAGFKLEEEMIRKFSGGDILTRLVFRFSRPEYQGKEPATASFAFNSLRPKAQGHASCSAYRETLGGDDSSYTPEEWNALHEEMVAADQLAAARVKRVLGKSL